MRRAARDAALVGAAAALMIGCQVGLSFLPNIELVSLLVVLYTQFFGKRTLFIIYVFALAEGLLYGFGMWWLNYLYVWTILYAIARRLRGMRSPLGWAIVNGAFGLLFGLLCAVAHGLFFGPYAAIAYFVQGIPFDLAHCAGNFAAALALYRPLSRVMRLAAERFGLAREKGAEE